MNIFNSSSVLAIVAINLISLLAQIVQIGTIAPTLALFLATVGATELEIGLIVASSWIAILVIYNWVPYIIYKLGAVNAILLSTFISSLSIAGMIFSTNIIALFMLNFTLGCGLIIRWVVCDTWLLLLTTVSNRGKVIGIHETLMGLGIAIGPLIIAITDNNKLAIFYSCIFLLLVSGVTTVLIRHFNCFPPIPTKSYDKKIAPLLLLSLFAALVAGAIETSVISFLPLMYISLGIATYVSSILLSSFGFGGALLQIPIGWLADKITVRMALLLICAVALATFVSLSYLGSSPTTYVVLFVCGGCISGLNTLAVVNASNRVQAHQISTSMMFIALAYTGGSILGPIITGYAIRYQKYGLVLASVLVLIVFFALVLFSKLHEKKKTES